MGGRLQDARDYERKAAALIREDERPAFHLTPCCGWMNDPNGFSYYGGKYHLFYQYNPYGMHWASMHWGHAVSEDLLRWEYLPAALAPDAPYDCDGCFSGSATRLDDGRQLLMYTGVRQEKLADGGIRDVQVQCLAAGDGTDYKKYEGNPVISSSMLPEGASTADFRDPKIWRKADGSFCCAVASRAADGSGQILLYESGDGFRWAFWKVLAGNHGRLGRMWECPDFFSLDGNQLLILSPQDMVADGEYHSGNGTVCIIGDFDEKTGCFRERQNQCIDCGIDFYAPQTLLAPDGRRIMIAWMQNWDSCAIREGGAWSSQMTLPRELSVRDGRLIQQPVRELERFRGAKLAGGEFCFSGEKRLEGLHGRLVDMELDIRPDAGDSPCHVFRIRLAEGLGFHTDIVYRPYEGTLSLDRRFSGSRRALLHVQESRLFRTEPGLRLRVVLDKYSVEVFANGGEQVMTAVFYTDIRADGISFCSDGKLSLGVEAYSLGS